nr:Chain Q, Peptide G [Homo sapiens]
DNIKRKLDTYLQ